MLFVSLLGLVYCKNYILTPKSEFSTLDLYKISMEHDLEVISQLADQFTFYTTTHENVLKYRNTLDQFFYIEQDAKITLNVGLIDNLNTVSNGSSVPWHLDRISKRHLPLDNYYPYDKCNTNKDIIIDNYVVDTGIDIGHPQFEGRAFWSQNFADDKDTDCNNHGTHVSGLIGSRDYGVCKNANLYAVKVLDCEGSGSLSGVIRGIEWVYKSHIQKQNIYSKKVVKSVINMSLGGGFSRALNKAIEYGVKNNDNFYVVVAAGNEDSDACTGSPSSVKSILTVMASDKDDYRAWFSNWGPCADLYSPGLDVLSTIPNNKTAVYSGTSMASPVLTGVLNHYLNMYPYMNMKDIKDKMTEMSSKEVILGERASTVRDLVYLFR